MSTLGNVPQVQGTGLRQFSGILSVTDVSGNNIATFASGTTVIGSTVGSTAIELIGDTTIFTDNTSTVANGGLIINNSQTSIGQSYIDFVYGSLSKGRLRNDAGGNMVYSSNGGIHQFKVNGDVGGTEALRIALNAQVLQNDLIGSLFRIGYMGWPQRGILANYTTVQSDAGKNIFNNVNSSVAVTLGLSALYDNGAVMMFSATDASSSRIVLSASPGENLIGSGGAAGSRTVNFCGNLVVMKIANANWFIISGIDYSPL